MDKEIIKQFVEEEDKKVMDYIEGKEVEDDIEENECDEDEQELDLPDDKLYLYDLLSLDPSFAMHLQGMSEKLSEERIVQIITTIAIRAAASVNNRNPIEGYYWATLTADLIMAICAKQEIDPMPISEFINDEQFEFILRQFETITSDLDEE